MSGAADPTPDETRTRALATTYFRAWVDVDSVALRAALADDVDFHGPMGTATGRDECITGLEGMRAHVMDSLDVELQLVEGADAMTFFPLHADGRTLPVVNRMHVGPDGVDRIQVVFDPRPLLG